MQLTFYNILIGLSITFFTVFSWEHYARTHEKTFKPSVFISWLATKFQTFYTRVGKIVAWVSSFYTMIDLKELWVTYDNLAKPTVDLLTSGLWTFKSYYDEMKLYDHPYLITLGSGTIVAVLSTVIYWQYAMFQPYLSGLSVAIRRLQHWH